MQSMQAASLVKDDSVYSLELLVSGAGPKHRQILEILEKRIRSGLFTPGGQFPTDAELVREFGVSRPTVARAVGELERAGLVERKRGAGTFVRVPSQTAERTFGLLIPGLGRTEIFEPICGEIARRVQASKDSLLWGSDGKPLGVEGDDTQSALLQCERYIKRGVSGVFFAPVEMAEAGREINERIVDRLSSAGVPLVLLDRDYVDYPDRSGFDLVGIDNRRVGWLVGRHLAERGAKRVMFVARPNSAMTIDAREDGLRAAAASEGMEVTSFRIDPGDPEVLRELISAQHPDAFVCGNDVTAARLLHTLDAIGIPVPDAALVAGFDDVKYAELLRVPLTTVHQPCEEIGQIAYQTMLERLASPGMPARDVLVRCHLVPRASTGARTTGED
ncbi:MAG: substrate-binding domain-containing protein, partial [Planctomycetota bacterium]